MNLRKLKDTIKELYYIEDEKILDLLLAIKLSREQKYMKLWLIIIGRSGEGKTELLRLIEDNNTKTLRSFTSKTLVNGHEEKKKKIYPDLAPKLKDKVILMPEMACILTATTTEKANIWAQLRDLYDGYAGKQSGMGKDIEYTNLNVSFIGCSTPDIDKQILIHQSLGTRELLYRTEGKDDEKLMTRILENTTKNKSLSREKLNELVQKYLKDKVYQLIPISINIEKELRKWANLLTYLRVSADIDYATGELLTNVYPEAPTRVLEQFITVYRSLKSLEEEYEDKEALKIIEKLVTSSCDPTRMEILLYLIRNNLMRDKGFSAREIAADINKSYKKVLAELNILSAEPLHLVNKKTKIDHDNDKTFYKFKANKENELTKHLAKTYQLEENLELNIQTIKI